MRRPVAALALSALLATGVAACGGDDSETSDIVPRSTPDLVAPEETGLPPARTAADDGTDTTTSTTETTTTPADGAGSAPATPTPAPAQPQQNAPQSGGQQAPPAQTQQQQQQQQDDGGNSGGFSDFCAENPGACPDE